MSSACPHNVVNFGLLTAEICWRGWATPVNFNGFHVLPSLMQRRRLPEANQTLHDVWPSPGVVHYIYTFGIFCLLTEFCHVQYSLCVHLRTIAQVSQAISLQLRHLSTVGKSLLNSNMSFRCPHNMVNFGPLAAEIGPVFWGTPANFNWYRVLAALLHAM